MVVETTDGDLGETDVSKPKVKDVVRDDDGAIRSLVVEKGVVFKKDIVVPANRIGEIIPEGDGPNEGGEVTVAASEPEIEGLSSVGTEALAPLKQRPPDASDVGDPLGELEERFPTAEGHRRNEGEASQRRREARQQQAAAPAPKFSLRTLGPGLLAGLSGNDATAVTSYAVNGVTAGYGQLWLMVLSTPLYQAVIYACGKIGRVTQQGLTEALRAHYGRKLALPIAILLTIANIALITGDLVAIGTGIELITGIPWIWFVAPAAAILWYIAVFQSFGVIKKIFLTLSFAFVAYLITGLFSGANWGDVLRGTVIPHISLGFAGISSAVALLGATLSPYTMFWQTQGEKEQNRPGTLRQQTRLSALDVASGSIGGNLIAYFIILTTSATLFTHHQKISSAADAARALVPLVGPFAKYLFAIGFIGAGVVAIPVLLASTSYALSGAFGWPASLWRKPWQSEGFYLIITGALLIGVALALTGLNPIQFIFWANVLQGVLAPVLMVIVLLMGNNRAIMREFRLGKLTNFWLVVAIVIAAAATVLLIVGLLTGQGGP